MIKVIFFVAMLIPGREPVIFEQEVQSLAQCLFEAHEFAVKPSNAILIEGGQLNVGCSMSFARSVVH